MIISRELAEGFGCSWVKTLTLESPKNSWRTWGKPGENPGEICKNVGKTCGKPWKGELGVSSQVKMVDFSARKRWIDRQKLRFEQLKQGFTEQKFGSNKKAMP